MANRKPATSLPVLSVQWDEQNERVSLITLGNKPYDYVLATSKDSGKGKVYESITHACNHYGELVEALRSLLTATKENLTGEVSVAEQKAIALLLSLGEL